MMSRRAAPLWVMVWCLSGCVRHAATPKNLGDDARAGQPPDDFAANIACTDWSMATDDRRSLDHESFPELSRAGCFVRVRYDENGPHADPVPEGCGYPDHGSLGAIERRAAVYETAARSWTSLRHAPGELACDLPDDVRRAAAKQNARTLRSLARTWADDPSLRRYPYAVSGTFGFGEPKQNESVLSRWMPGEPCVTLSDKDLRLFSVNVARARRAAEAYHAGIAPLVTVSGGAIHSSVYESFFLTHLVQCNFDVPADRILVDPCADHTHTNIRNTGAIIVGIGGRDGYLVTDDGIQSAYLEEWTAFDLVGGSLDQRAQRDFGYSIGAWRRASVGMHAGYWYSPFRFWAAPHDGLGSFTCMGDFDR